MSAIGRMSHLMRAAWIGLQLESPPLVRRAVLPRIHEAKDIARLLLKPQLPIDRLRGRGNGGPLDVAYIGLDNARPFVIDILFEDKPGEERIGRAPFWRGEQLATIDADLVIVEAAKHVIRRLPGRNAIVLPQFVRHMVDVRGDWQQVKSRFHKKARHEWNQVQKQNYEYEISHDAQDFEAFYRDMYLPTMRTRHGDLASPTSIDEAREYFRRGFLFWLKRDGQRACASLGYTEQGILHFLIMGVLAADEQLMKEGVVTAMNLLRLHWANQNGFAGVNFLGSNPFLNDGLFQYKRRWGGAINVPPHLHRQLWIKINRRTPAVAEFLQSNPLITVDGRGDLHGLICVDDLRQVTPEQQVEWEKRYATPGLKSLQVRAVDDLIEQPAADRPRLVIPILPGATAGD